MAGDDDEREYRDYYGELTDWLSDKSEDVWFDSVDHINWDEGVPVLMWMVDQPQCTWPLAASIFWAAGPDFYAARMLEGDPVEEGVDESYELILRILKNWRAGLYARGGVAFAGPTGPYYQARLARHPGRGDPLDIPESLFASFPGRMPRVPAALTPYADAHLWDLYYGACSTQCGWRPGSARWTPPEQPYRTAYETERVSAAARTTNAPPAKTTPFLRILGLMLFFGALLIAAALIAHRLRVGTW
jgi:hypothetical protein